MPPGLDLDPTIREKWETPEPLDADGDGPPQHEPRFTLITRFNADTANDPGGMGESIAPVQEHDEIDVATTAKKANAMPTRPDISPQSPNDRSSRSETKFG
ncbi:hypothetical protein MMC18_005189 [Xylographa bjoerkii]|nr:hypothetical protein [Xylographa bjoerkii]